MIGDHEFSYILIKIFGIKKGTVSIFKTCDSMYAVACNVIKSRSLVCQSIGKVLSSSGNDSVAGHCFDW